MTNEELVQSIQDGFFVTEYMEKLYNNNLGMINKIIKKYTAYAETEDLLQESYFGLWEAVQHYESSENVLFIVYAAYWIRQSAIRYLEKCGFIVRMPSHRMQLLSRYKKIVRQLEQELRRTPTDKEVSQRMGISEKLLPELRIHMQGVASLETPLPDDPTLSLSDVLKSDFDLENDIIDKMYRENIKIKLWDIVGLHTTELESCILREYFAKKKTMTLIAKEQGITLYSVRMAKEKGLHKLRIGKAKRKLLNEIEVSETGMYRTGNCRFKIKGSSSVEEFILRKEKLEEEYQQKMKDIFTSYDKINYIN